MLQIDHVYEFFKNSLVKKDFAVHLFLNGYIDAADYTVFTAHREPNKILFYDQEPLILPFIEKYLDQFISPLPNDNDTIADLINKSTELTDQDKSFLLANLDIVQNRQHILVNTEYSQLKTELLRRYNIKDLYYFFHGFAALDWYRGFYSLNYSKQVIQDYTYDYITFNRLVSNDRSYRCYFVSRLSEELLLEHGQVSFGLSTEQATWQEEIADSNTKLSTKAINHIKLHLPSRPLIIDNEHVLGSASADIPRCANDSFWHVVTETVFYYDKLHLTEKIFKPIVMKQPFMLVAAPGNLAYLKSYGFKTFDSIIDESYDQIQDPDSRIDAVVNQLVWYCTLSVENKQEVMRKIEPIVEYNFHHFYGEFKHIITRELLDNTKSLYKEIGYNDSTVAYDDVYKVLTT